MNMIGACWMRRSLGEPVSALLIDSDNCTIAGGWNGILTKWSSEGDRQWSAQLPDRIASISIDENGIYACAGLHLVAVDSDSGAILWQHALEGSADEVTTFSGLIYATSSVYDIEHNDFIDSAIWCFDSKGEKVWETHMDERPWTMVVSNNQVILGLGRPMMGAAIVDNNGALTYQTLDSESPVTTGIDSANGVIFGHANGDVTTMEGKSMEGLGDAISNICAASSELITVSKDREVVTLNANFEPQWASEIGTISTISTGFSVENKPTIWVGIQNGINGQLNVIHQESGEIISSMECARINSIASSSDMIVAGDEQGELFVWQDEMFRRRLTSTESNDNDEHRQTMRDRLKALRKR